MMTNLELLLKEFCCKEDLTEYMNGFFPDGWGEEELQEEADTNIEYILGALDIPWREWMAAKEEELVPDPGYPESYDEFGYKDLYSFYDIQELNRGRC